VIAIGFIIRIDYNTSSGCSSSFYRRGKCHIAARPASGIYSVSYRCSSGIESDGLIAESLGACALLFISGRVWMKKNPDIK